MCKFVNYTQASEIANPFLEVLNEEIYGILSGEGKVVIDGEELALTTGDWLRIAPAAKRQFFAGAASGITFICIQVKENSLDGFTAGDAVVY